MFWLVIATATCYALASGAFLLYLFGQHQRLLEAARPLLGMGALIHLCFLALVFGARNGLAHLQDLHGALSLSAFLLVVGYLAFFWRWRFAVLGAFVAPVATVLTIALPLTPVESLTVSGQVTHLLGKMHIIFSALGVAVFGLAAAMACLYLLQERALKRKKVGSLLLRLPALTALDEVGQRLLLIGFPLFTLSVITGMLWTRRLPVPEGFRLGHVLSWVTWFDYGILIVARYARGWRGRRVAWLTIFGFLVLVIVLLLYLVRRVWGV